MGSLNEMRRKIVDIYKGGLKNYGQSDNYLKNFTLLELLAKNRFEWKNLPKGVESRHIENALFQGGQAFFMKIENEYLKEPSYVCLPCTGVNQLNFYGEPIAYNVIGTGKQWDNVTLADGVLIRDSVVSFPSSYYVQHYADKITRVENSMDVNLRQQKYPFIIVTNDKMRLSSKTLMNKVDKGEESIFVDEEMTSLGKNCGVEVLQTGVPYLLDKLEKHCDYQKKQCLTFLGLNCCTEKKERMLVDEVNVNNSEIEITLESFYKTRVEACKRINELYGLNIEVVKVVEEIGGDKVVNDDKDI